MAVTRKAFGVYQDGDELRIAAVILDGDTLAIESIYKEHLSEKQAVDKALQEQFASPFDEPTTGFGDEEAEFDFGAPGDSKDETALEFEELDTTEASIDKPSSLGDQDSLTRAAMAMQLQSGPICANLDVSNVTYRRIALPEKTPEKKIPAEVRKAFYSPEQRALCAYTYFRSDEPNEVVGIRHEGSMELLENLVQVNQDSFNREFEFCHVQPNEVALMNAVRYNYEIFGDDVIAIFYIGVDFSRITLMRGESFLLELPIINEGYGSENILNTVYSRYLLEKAHHDIPSLDRIYLAGSGLSGSTMELLREKEPDAAVEYLLPKKMMNDIEAALEYSNEELAEYIIPIMMATACLLPREPLLFQANFLPKQLRRQKTFALGYGGIGILAVVIAVVLLGMHGLMMQRSNIRQLQADIQELNQRIDVNMAVIMEIQGMEAQIVEHENNLARVKALIGDRNQWHFILEEISDSFIDNYLSWSTNIHKEEGGQFRLKGSTTRRTNIVAFSLLFPFGRIEKVVEKEIEGYTVWDYEITYSMPDPLHTQQLDYKREGIDVTPPTLEDVQAATKANPAPPEPAPVVQPPVQTPPPAAQPVVTEQPKPQPVVTEQPKPQPVATEQPKPQPAPAAEPQPSEEKPEGPVVIKGPDQYDAALKTYFRGDLDKATEMFEAYIAGTDSRWVTNATYFLGEIQYRKGNYAKAIERFQSVLELGNRKQADAMMMLGNSYEKNGQTQKAIDHWKRLIVEYPNSQYIDIAKRKINEAGEE